MSNLIASFEICELFAANMSAGMDYDSLEVRKEEDLDFLGDNDPEPIVPTMAEIREEQVKAKAMDQLLDIQDRMAKGMNFINEVTKERNNALQNYLKQKELFKQLMEKLNVWTEKYGNLSYAEQRAKGANFRAWKNRLWANANPVKDGRNTAWKTYEDSKVKLSKYWERWKALKEQSMEVASEHNLWPDYFNLLNEDIHQYWCNSDAEELDNLELLYRKDYSEDLARAHIFEMNAYDVDVHVDWTYQDERIVARMENQDLDLESLLASNPF